MLVKQRPGDKHALYTSGRADQPPKTTIWRKRFNYARYWRLILSDWAAAAISEGSQSDEPWFMELAHILCGFALLGAPDSSIR